MKIGPIPTWFFLAIMSLGVILLSSGCANTVQVKGESMAPTIREGDRLTTDPNAFKDVGPQRGNIILYEYNGQKRLSRVIGLPGETITVKDGIVYVNGNKLDEPYLASGIRTESDTKEFRVPEGSYFVLGDNRGKSNDSRAIGYISRGQITAKIPR